MPMFEPARTHEVIDFVFSLLKKQADYATITADADLLARVQCLGFSPGEIQKTFSSDANRVGREFASARTQLAQGVRLSRNFECSSHLIGLFAAYCLGKLTTVGAGPTYTHTIIFQDPATTKLVPVMTVYEQIWGQTNVKRRLKSLAVADFSVQGRAREIAQLAVNFIGSGEVTASALAAIPTPLTETKFDLGSAVFKIGAPTAATDLTTRLIDFQVQISAGLDEATATYPGSGLYHGRMYYGRRAASFSCTVFADSASTDLYDTQVLADTVREVSFKLVNGAHSVEFLFPACKPRVSIVEVEGKIAYRIEASTPDDILLDGGGTPNAVVQVTVVNGQVSMLG